MLKLLFKIISWPTWELSCTYAISLMLMFREMYLEILGPRRIQKSIFAHKDVLLYTKIKKLWKEEFS